MSKWLSQPVTYLDTTWMQNAAWSHHPWCIHCELVLTNNDVNSWQKWLNTEARPAPRLPSGKSPGARGTVHHVPGLLLLEQCEWKQQHCHHDTIYGHLHDLWTPDKDCRQAKNRNNLLMKLAGSAIAPVPTLCGHLLSCFAIQQQSTAP